MKLDNFTYRRARMSDLEQLKKLGLLAYGQFQNVLGNENWELMKANLKDDSTYLYLLKIAHAFVCENEDGIIAMAYLIPQGNPTDVFQSDWAYIRLVAVHPKYNGKGIGKKITEQCINFAKELGEKTIALHTSEFMNAARYIYENLGFSKVRDLGLIFGKQYYLYVLELQAALNISYHKAKLDDVSTLVENRILFALELSGKQNEESISLLRQQITNYFAKAIEENTCISFIAKHEGIVAGIGSMHIREMPGNFKNPSGKWAYIMNMYTVPEFRRKGVCKGILNLLIEEGKKYGISAFELHATKDGEPVYTKEGFHLHKEPTLRKFI